MGVEKIKYLQDEGFLLRSVRYGDDHRIISCLTQHNGRVDLLVYSALKSLKRGFGVLDFTHRLDLQFKFNRPGSLGQLTQCELIKSYPRIHESFNKAQTALLWFKTLIKIIPEGGNAPGVFQLLTESLADLEAHSYERCDIRFHRHLLTRLGYHLELGKCIHCQSDSSENYHFFTDLGGLVCPDCYAGREGIPLMAPILGDLLDDQMPSEASAQGVLRQLKVILQRSYSEYLGLNLEAPASDFI